MKKPELLIPASSLEVLKTAVLFGADAVYIGGEAFGLRAKAKNFSPEEMRQGIAFAHERGVKVRRSISIFLLRLTIPTIWPGSSGMAWEQSEWSAPGSFRWRR